MDTLPVVLLVESLNGAPIKKPFLIRIRTANFFSYVSKSLMLKKVIKQMNQEIILYYNNFGKDLEECLNYYKTLHPKQIAKMFANEEKKITEDSLQKNSEKARKNCELFNGINGGTTFRGG